MAKAALKKQASTQKFIEIVDIIDDIVILSGGYACLAIEVKATNFELLSADEQDAKIGSYANLLNSLSFSIQILIRSKRVDVSSYLKLLEEQKNETKNTNLATQIGLYKDFVEELVKVNVILDKKFYIIIPYSSLEKGISGARETVSANSSEGNFFIGAKTALRSKAESLHAQLGRLNLRAKTLEKENLTKLFYDIFNDGDIGHHEIENLVTPVTKGKEATA